MGNIRIHTDGNICTVTSTVLLAYIHMPLLADRTSEHTCFALHVEREAHQLQQHRAVSGQLEEVLNQVWWDRIILPLVVEVSKHCQLVILTRSHRMVTQSLSLVGLIRPLTVLLLSELSACSADE